MYIVTDKELLSKDPKTAKSFLLPYNDTYVINVDIETKIITVQNGFDILEAS